MIIDEEYQTSLKIMLSTNEKLANAIATFIEKIPGEAMEKFKKVQGKVKSIRYKQDNILWTIEKDEEGLSVSMGDANRYTDYYNIYLLKMDKSTKTYQFLRDTDKCIGFFTFFLPKEKPASKQEQVCYSFYVSRVEDRKSCMVELKTLSNTTSKELSEKLEKENILDTARSIYEKNKYILHVDERMNPITDSKKR